MIRQWPEFWTLKEYNAIRIDETLTPEERAVAESIPIRMTGRQYSMLKFLKGIADKQTQASTVFQPQHKRSNT